MEAAEGARGAGRTKLSHTMIREATEGDLRTIATIKEEEEEVDIEEEEAMEDRTTEGGATSKEAISSPTMREEGEATRDGVVMEDGATGSTAGGVEGEEDTIRETGGEDVSPWRAVSCMPLHACPGPTEADHQHYLPP